MSGSSMKKRTSSPISDSVVASYETTAARSITQPANHIVLKDKVRLLNNVYHDGDELVAWSIAETYGTWLNLNRLEDGYGE